VNHFSQIVLDLFAEMFHSFIHPNDPNWRYAKATDRRVKPPAISRKPPGNRRTNASSSMSTGNKAVMSRSRTGSPRPGVRARHRMSPLVSQTDLFQRRKVDVADRSSNHQHNVERLHHPIHQNEATDSKASRSQTYLATRMSENSWDRNRRAKDRQRTEIPVKVCDLWF
jgi:hypothetical protein